MRAPREGIRFDAIYLACLLFIVPITIVVLWLEFPKSWLGLQDPKYKTLLKYSLAWLGGVLGGTLFDVKWLYHSVARQVWHLDRRLWRLFTPHISGGLAFAIIALISSGLLRIFDRQAVESNALVIGVAFLVGYFSDSAIAKLSEIAETIFGASRGKEKHRDKLKPSESLPHTNPKESDIPTDGLRGSLPPKLDGTVATTSDAAPTSDNEQQ